MKPSSVAVAICIAFLSGTASLNLSFPDDFQIGVVTSNIQVEGAWNASDKSESIWDHLLHENPSKVTDLTNTDVTADSYHKYKEDVQLIKNIGFDVYRFSISWPRLLPNGFATKISADGLQYYKNLTQELIDNGIEPVVVLSHLDHPQILEEYGGWTNEIIVDLFVDYARVVFKEFGPLVKTFLTINEPQILCEVSYQDGLIAPGKILGIHGKYLCAHNALKAHAKAWHLYDDEFRPTQKGRIGLIQSCYSYLPLNASDPDDVLAAEYGFEFNCGWMSHPLYVGDYPESMRTRIDEISKTLGYSKSILPEFTAEEIEYIKGATDFIALNYYQTHTTRLLTEEELAANPSDTLVSSTKYNSADYAAPGLRHLLNVIRVKYDNPTIVIAENGFHSDGELDDYDRISYFYEVVSSMLQSIYEDGSNVIGYWIWALVDTFEGETGYTKRLGLHHLDIHSDNRTRTPRLSADWWKTVVEARELQPVPTSDA